MVESFRIGTLWCSLTYFDFALSQTVHFDKSITLFSF